jgi:hypothetical protein
MMLFDSSFDPCASRISTRAALCLKMANHDCAIRTIIERSEAEYFSSRMTTEEPPGPRTPYHLGPGPFMSIVDYRVL